MIAYLKKLTDQFSGANAPLIPARVFTSPLPSRSYLTSPYLVARQDPRIGTWAIVRKDNWLDFAPWQESLGVPTKKMIETLCRAELGDARARGYASSFNDLVQTLGAREGRGHILRLCRDLQQAGMVGIQSDKMTFNF